MMMMILLREFRILPILYDVPESLWAAKRNLFSADNNLENWGTVIDPWVFLCDIYIRPLCNRDRFRVAWIRYDKNKHRIRSCFDIRVDNPHYQWHIRPYLTYKNIFYVKKKFFYNLFRNGKSTIVIPVKKTAANPDFCMLLSDVNSTLMLLLSDVIRRGIRIPQYTPWRFNIFSGNLLWTSTLSYSHSCW